MSPYRVLLIDDQKIVGAAIGRMLLPATDLTLHHHMSPQDALAQLEAFDPHVLLLDLSMPEIDGLQVLAQVRAQPAWEHLPVVVMSGHDDPQVKVTAFERGATDYLIKLPNPVELTARLRNHGWASQAARERLELAGKLDRIQKELKATHQRLSMAAAGLSP